MRNLKMILLLLSVLMTSGCKHGQGAADLPDWGMPLVVDYSNLSCPEADPAAAKEFSRTVKAPVPDLTEPDGRKAVSKGLLKTKFDEFRTAEQRKNAAGWRVLREYEACRSGTSNPKKIS